MRQASCSPLESGRAQGSEHVRLSDGRGKWLGPSRVGTCGMSVLLVACGAARWQLTPESAELVTRWAEVHEIPLEVRSSSKVLDGRPWRSASTSSRRPGGGAPCTLRDHFTVPVIVGKPALALQGTPLDSKMTSKCSSRCYRFPKPESDFLEVQ